MLKGNKGEWSEIYVFLKLLADGKLNAADANLDIIPNVFYPLIKIIRQETSSYREYIINSNIEIYDEKRNEILASRDQNEFLFKSKELLDLLRISKGASLSFSSIESFLKEIGVSSLCATHTDKADIRIVVHDLNTGMKPNLGFSIKSMIGKDSTLFNAGSGTNFIFKLIPPNESNLDINSFNRETLHKAKESSKLSKISLRISELERLKFGIKFHEIQSENLALNLKLIDSQLPEILAYIVYYRFKYGISKVNDLINILKDKNPLNFNLTKGHPFYESKIRNFLTESALGMTPESVWTGIYDATGGIIIVKQSGELVCYHIYNKKEFQDYLMNNTKLEQPSTSEDDNNPGFAKESKSKPFKYSWVYEEKGELFLKLNLQIRFT